MDGLHSLQIFQEEMHGLEKVHRYAIVEESEPFKINADDDD